VAAGFLAASTLGTGYAVHLGWRAVAESLASVPLDRIPLRLGDWEAKGNEPIPQEVSNLLAQDTGLYRVYTNNLGQEVHCWVMYWSSLATVHGYHHPDVCWGNRGGVPTYRGLEVVAPSSGGRLPLTARRFDVTGGQNFILYWTQDGPRVWDAATEARASVQGMSEFSSGHGWVADLLAPPADRPPGRLTVVLATRHVGPTAERETAELARRLADELFTLCPWAAPPHAAGEPSP
jgi:hypothetical protein